MLASHAKTRRLSMAMAASRDQPVISRNILAHGTLRFGRRFQTRQKRGMEKNGRGADGVRELAMARRGTPSPVFAPKGPQQRPWRYEHPRCPLAALAALAGAGKPKRRSVQQLFENEVSPDGSKPPVWFAFDESQPQGFFAGIWRWTSVRKVREGATTNDLFAFLTTEPNAEVALIHPKAMPVILTTSAEGETWMSAPTQVAIELL
jgi:hypothetical protein